MKVNTMSRVNNPRSRKVSCWHERVADRDCSFSPPLPSRSALLDADLKKKVNMNRTRVAVPRGASWPH